MGTHRPIVLGCDPGEVNSAFGVMGDGVVLHSSLLFGPTTPWDDYCVQFQEMIERLIGIHAVELLAIEDFRWRGRHVYVETPVRELIGIARTFSRAVTVLVIDSREWSHAITGTQPSNRGHDFETSQSWKKTIRRALDTRFQLMGIDLNRVVGKDTGSHLTDSLALSLYAQDMSYIQSHATRSLAHGAALVSRT